MNNRNYLILAIFFVITAVVVVSSTSYAFLSVNRVQNDPNIVSTACFNVSFNDNKSRIYIDNAYPMSDAKGLQTSPYTFSVTNNCAAVASYQVYINIKNTTATDLLPQIFYSIDGSSVNLISDANEVNLPTGATSSNIIGTYLIDSGTLETLNSNKSYNLRIWIGEHAGNVMMGKKIEAEIMVYSVPSASTTSIKSANLTNLIPNGSFEDNGNWNGVSYDSEVSLYGNKSNKFAGGVSLNMTTVAMSKPIVNHIYYGRHSIKTDGNVNAADDRFEWFAGDGAGLNFVFGHNNGNHPTWYTESAVINVTAVNGTDYIIRNFTVNPKANLWNDGLMIIDLTAAFGAGNEPSKAWCDANIPYFEGTKKINYLNLT